MNTPSFEQLDEMAKAIRARLLGRDDEWAVIDEAARMAYRLAARDAWEISQQQPVCGQPRPVPDHSKSTA